MGVIIPSIPYKSQLDPDASEFRNDCGPACIAMVLQAFGHNVTTNAVYRKTGTKADGYVHISQMMRASASYGVPYDYFSGWNIDRLKQAVSEGRPVITLVHYGAWSSIDPGVSTQSSFTGPHFVVVLGYDNKNVYVNDPLWTGSRRQEGYRKSWTFQQFNAAWGSNHEDGQRDFSGIVCRLSLPTETYGGGPDTPGALPPPQPEFQLDPAMSRRIMAWAAMMGIPQPDITSPAVANAYIEAMGPWGERVVEHKVEASDTLGLLALRYYDDPLKWEVITLYNGLTPADAIFDNDVLLIPEPLERPVEVPDNLQPEGSTPPNEDGRMGLPQKDR